MKSSKIMLGIIAAVLFSYFAIGANLNCSITPAGSCTNTIVLYLQNETGGYDNAHAQNASVGTYNYAVCCDANAAGDTINASCENPDAIFLKLSSTTNAHVQQASVGTYSVDACISAESGTVTCSYAKSCTAEQTCLVSMASSEGDNTTNAHVASCGYYETQVCCSMTSPPTTPKLYKPENGNQTIHDRTPTFIWFNSTDPDGTNITYRIWVDNDKTFASPEISAGGIPEGNMWGNATNYTNTSTILNVDTTYYWKVQACDSAGACTNSTTWNFTIESYIEVTLLNAGVSFGTMLPGETNDTLDWMPPPIVVENRGNLPVNINVTATNLFTEAPNPSSYFQCRIEENETNSYLSAMDWDWFNLNQTVYNTTITKLNWTDSNDAANIHIKVTVPRGEPPATRTANITINAW